MRTVLLVLCLCSDMWAQASRSEESEPDFSSSVAYAVHYSYDDMGNMVLRHLAPMSSFSRFLEEKEEKKNLFRTISVNVSADAAWSSVLFSIAGPQVESGQLLIYTTSGQLVMNHAFSSNMFTLDLSRLNRRLYLFRLSTEGRTEDFKLLKTR